MKRLTALILALALFTIPTVAMAVDHPKLADMFDQYVDTILLDQGS
ncbi:MAG: hypothetical protein ACE5MK_13015 [Acidobacteriota bacterium]